MARQADDAHVECEVFPAKLRPDAALAGGLEHLRLELDIAEGAAVFVAGGREVVVILRGGEFDVFHRRFGRGAADDEGQMVRRARGGAERDHFVGQKLHDALRIEHGAGFLIQESLVRRAASFGDEEELIRVAIGGIQIELRGQVGAGVLFVEHVQRGVLRVAQVVLRVGEIDALRERGLVTAAGPDLLAFFAHDDGGAGVLAERQQARGGHVGILEHRERHHAVVFARFLVIEDGGDLLQVLRPQEEIDVMKRLVREQRERLGIDDEHLLIAEFFDANVILGQQAVFGVVGAEFEERLVVESGGWHESVILKGIRLRATGERRFCALRFRRAAVTG